MGASSKSRNRSAKRKAFSSRRQGPLSSSQRRDVNEAFAARFATERMHALIKALRPVPGQRALWETVRDAYELLDSTLDEITFTPPIVCARGCHHCCYNQISLTPAEALYLGFHLLENFTPEHRKVIASKVNTLLETIRGMTRLEIAAIRHELPCVLLEDGACSVHPARPLACRGWNAVDAAQCRASVELRDPQMMIENHELHRQLAEAVQFGFLQGSKELNLEAGYLLLPRALHLLLEYGILECSETWLHGGAFFARKILW